MSPSPSVHQSISQPVPQSPRPSTAKRTPLFAIICLAIVFSSLSASACWFTELSFKRNYIAAINNQIAFYSDATWNSGVVPCPDNLTISLPATIYIVLAPGIGDPPITQALLQYKKLPSGSWTTIKNLTNLNWSINSTSPLKLFGKNILDPQDVSPGDTILVRLYVTDGITENAPLANDTTEDGTNLWQDQWVVALTINSNRRPQ
ncbi:MAG: hypothetical protein L3J71_03460 [Victivallaceae bacterium]|nr:hypothetical protein [Victivallaceae bacterium]